MKVIVTGAPRAESDTAEDHLGQAHVRRFSCRRREAPSAYSMFQEDGAIKVVLKP